MRDAKSGECFFSAPMKPALAHVLIPARIRHQENFLLQRRRSGEQLRGRHSWEWMFVSMYKPPK